MIVMKFGGTSLGTAQSIREVCAIIQSAISKRPIVVVSAVHKMTNALLELASEPAQNKKRQTFESIKQVHNAILKELELPSSIISEDISRLELMYSSQSRKKNEKINAKTLDLFSSFGEQLSSKIVAAYLLKKGIKATAWNAWDLGLITNSNFAKADILGKSYAIIQKKMEGLDHIPIVTGFIAKDEKGNITTLGRGGSDYTAAIIGAAIKADSIQVWKEVDGLMTADPKLIPEAKIVSELAFEEASELAYFGAKVLHPKTIVPAMKAGIKVEILNTFKPKERGTTIISNFEKRKKMSKSIDALTFKKGLVAIHVHSPEFFEGNEVMAKILKLFARHKVNIDELAISVASISLVMAEDKELPKIVEKLKEIGEVTIDKDKAMICAVGGSLNAAGVAGRMFTALGKNQIAVEMISQAASGFSITFLVHEKDAENTIKILHKEYIG